MEELSKEALRRAIKYEEKVRRSEKKLVLECIKEIDKERPGQMKNKWEEKRRKALEKTEARGEEIRKNERGRGRDGENSKKDNGRNE